MRVLGFVEQLQGLSSEIIFRLYMFQSDFVPQQVGMSLEMACDNLNLIPLPGPESFEDELQPYTTAD
jgi:hypothetical protein